MGSSLAEIVFCIGFIIVYLADEILHLCCGEAIHHQSSQCRDEYHQILPSYQHVTSYGSNENQTSRNEAVTAGTPASGEQCYQHDAAGESSAEIGHTNHQVPSRQTLAGIIGMLTALSIHSILEGLAIGIQDTTAKVMILFTAVISHKLVVSFCLGVELCASQGSKFLHHFLAIFLFSAGSAIGILIGMGLVDLNNVTDSKFLPVMQGIAGGTLLYVTLCEVLPREKARWCQSQFNKTAGISQFLAFSTGFAVMTLMNLYITEGD